MAEVGDVKVRFSADTSSLEAGVTQATRLMDGLKTAAAGLGIAFGIREIAQFANHMVDLGDRLSDLSDQTGISISALAGLRVTAEQAGSSIEAVALGTRMMLRNIAEGADGTGRQADALKKLGISAADLAKYANDPEGGLEAIGKGLGNLGTKAEQFATAQALVGRGGSALLPVLQRIATEGMPRVSEAVEHGYKALGDLKDQTVGLIGRVLDLTAALFGLASASPLSTLQSVNDQITLLENRKNATGLMKFLGPGEQDINRQLDIARAQQRGLLNDMQQADEASRKPHPIDVLPDKAALDKIKAIIEALEKQNIAIKAEMIALTEGEAAALKWKITQDLMAETMGHVTPQMIALRDKIVAAKEALDNYNLSVEGTKQVNESLAKTQSETDTALKNYGDAMRTLKEGSMSEYEKKLMAINDQYKAMILAMEKVSGGVASPGDKAAADTWRSNQFRSLEDSAGTLQGVALKKLDDELRVIDIQAGIFGDSFDAAGARLQAFRGMVTSLGIDLNTLDPIMAARIAQLKDMEEAAKLGTTIEGLIRGAGTGITDTIRGIAQGTQTVSQGFKNMALNAVNAINDVIFKLLILDPLIKSIKDSINANASGGGGGGIWGMLGSLFGMGASALGSTGTAAGGSALAAGGTSWGGSAWSIGAGTGSGMFGFAEGGIVGGPVGSPQMAVVHGGEEVIPVGGGKGGNVTYNIDARGAQRGVSQEIQQAINKSENRAVTRSVGAVSERRQRSNNFAHVFGGR